MKIITLTASYNRSSCTNNALQSLTNQNINSNIEFEHFVVDDKSTDDTVENILRYFHDIKIINGKGNMYWAGGMRYGYEELKSKQFDYLFIYNDDCTFLKDAIDVLVNTHITVTQAQNKQVLVVGAFLSKDCLRMTYGGRLTTWPIIYPLGSRLANISNEPLRVDTLNMNACLIPFEILHKIGFLKSYFVHGSADWEFGLRCNKNGFGVYQAPGHIGYCDNNKTDGTSRAVDIGCFERIRRVTSVKEVPIYPRYMFSREYCGLSWPLSFAVPYIMVIFLCVSRIVNKLLRK